MAAAWLAGVLPVLPLAVEAIEAVRAAAVRAGATGALADDPLDPERVAAAFGSSRLFRDGGLPPAAFGPLTGFFPTTDGWLRTHTVYPHHRQRLLELLGLDATADRDAFAARIAERSAAELENQSAAAGAIAVRVRSEADWRASAPGTAAGAGPLVAVRARDDGPPARALAGGTRPLTGVRVLDLTRVLAGPVCGRTLALLGADVLRIDPPSLPENPLLYLDTGQGKRSALLDLNVEAHRGRELLAAADVLVTGYRPGALDRFDLRPHPGLVRARVNAWGDAGPWADRRGFDSIVQAATGISFIESPDGGATPGSLPAEALDHATGYLLAAAVIDALAARAVDGRGRDVQASLARTAHWLLDHPGRDPYHPPAAVPTARATVTHGRRTTARPAIPGFDDYSYPARPWGADPAAFPGPRPAPVPGAGS